VAAQLHAGGRGGIATPVDQLGSGQQHALFSPAPLVDMSNLSSVLAVAPADADDDVADVERMHCGGDEWLLEPPAVPRVVDGAASPPPLPALGAAGVEQLSDPFDLEALLPPATCADAE
jgi:hypothetical protein